MQRRNFLQKLPTLVPVLSAGGALASSPDLPGGPDKPVPDREYWVRTMIKIADPVLNALSSGKLKAVMPVESAPGQLASRQTVTYLEAFGRLLAGIAPWLALGPDSNPEGKLREKYIRLSRQSLANAVNPDSPDYMNFTQGGQPLVDAAFLAHGLLRAPDQLWQTLDESTRRSSRLLTTGCSSVQWWRRRC
jgi:hypothetical protein